MALESLEMHPFDLQLDKEYVRNGEWWLPANSDRRVPGRLIYGPETGVNIDCGNRQLSWGTKEIHLPQTLHGNLEFDGQVSILQSYGSIPGSGEIKTQWFSWSTALIGLHAESFDEPIDGCMLRIDNLNDWVAKGPFRDVGKANSIDNVSVVRFQYEIDMSLKQKWEVPSAKAAIAVEFIVGQKFSTHSTTLSHNYHLSVNFPNRIPLNEAVDLINNFELLITLLTGSQSLVQSIVILVSPYPPHTHDIHLLHNRPCRQSQQRMFHRDVMPVTITSVESEFATVLDRWFALCLRCAPVIKLLRSSLFRSGTTFIEDQFLTIAQAVEGYCRIIQNEKLLPEGEFAPIKASLIDCVPRTSSPRFQELARSRIGGLNDLALSDRLLWLFDRNDWLNILFTNSRGNQSGTSADAASFTADIARTRNRLTHVESGGDMGMTVDLYKVWKLHKAMHTAAE